MGISGVFTPKLGLDLRGGTTITLTAANVTGQGSVDPNSLELARSIIQQRVDSHGRGRDRGDHQRRSTDRGFGTQCAGRRTGGDGRPDRPAVLPQGLQRGRCAGRQLPEPRAQ
ncbi:MAG: hypothetical protein QM804_18505 [Propionicimonas sp.]